MEPLTISQGNNRFSIFPIKYRDIFDAAIKQKNCFWTFEEIEYGSDLKDWNTLDKNAQFFIKRILAFFAGADGIVLENLLKNFTNEVEIPEVRYFYAFQGMMENEHNLTYNMLLDTFITDPKEKDEAFHAIDTIPCIGRKADWAIKWMDPEKKSFSTRLIAFAVVEGVFFSGSFCAIFWVKCVLKKMKNALGKSNELISRDEGMHTDFAILLYKYIVKKVPVEEVYDIFREAVEIEKDFIIDSIPCKMIGMDSEKMCQYIQYVADRLLLQLGYPKLYNAENPFDFMMYIALDGKTNFFEGTVTEYQIASTKKDKISFDEDF